MGFVDLHRHDEFSTFDGFGKAKELAALAKELGHAALSTSNHGNTNGLVQTYRACMDEGIKPILGVEGYMLPKYKPQARGYHLCLFAKNLVGYQNLNKIQYEGEKQKYYNPIWDFSILEKHADGLICTSACVAGYMSQAIMKGKVELAAGFAKKMVEIFGEDFYIEIQPYKIDDKNTQENVNEQLMILAEELGVKCILTSDSHRGKKEDFDTYLKMHEIANHDLAWIEDTYKERYMPTEKEIMNRMLKMHGEFLKENGHNPKASIKDMMKTLSNIVDSVEPDILGQLELKLPQMVEGKDSYDVLLQNVKDGLKDRGKWTKEYAKRCKEELEVIKYHGFSDYFLIVADYVNWAKEQGIAVGPGRGSVCNCLVAYAVGITDVDSIKFGLDFRRFMRKDKKKYPDIDIDFETSRRAEAIRYLCEKYKGHAARICAYGLYKTDNLINDLAKVCGLDTLDKEIDDAEKRYRQSQIADIKSFVNMYANETGSDINTNSVLKDDRTKMYNKQYDNIIKHFCKLYKKVRYIGTHAAGVAITGGDLSDYTAIRISKDGDVFTNYDLIDVEDVNVIKFDLLGLKTMESIGELRKLTGNKGFKEEWLDDPSMYEAFRDGRCDGVFQYEKGTARGIMSKIQCDCFDDLVAASAMNRPGPLQLKMPDKYAANKLEAEGLEDIKYLDYTKESYGTIIYQEQIMTICVNIGDMDWGTADKIIKMMKSTSQKEQELKQQEDLSAKLLEEFYAGAKKRGFSYEEAEDLFVKMTDSYSFNKGHAVGYALISAEEMYYKLYYPNEYWYVKIKYAKNDSEVIRFSELAVKDDAVIFLPHVNYSAKCTLRKQDGDNVIQLGLNTIKGIGDKAADAIEEEKKKNGVFTNYDNFYDRCVSRSVHSGVINKLKESGALEFKRKTYIGRIIKYNSSLYARG